MWNELFRTCVCLCWRAYAKMKTCLIWRNCNLIYYNLRNLTVGVQAVPHMLLPLRLTPQQISYSAPNARHATILAQLYHPFTKPIHQFTALQHSSNMLHENGLLLLHMYLKLLLFPKVASYNIVGKVAAARDTGMSASRQFAGKVREGKSSNGVN